MRLNELKKLVNKTVRQEQRNNTKRRKNSKRKFNSLVENAVRRVLLEDDDLAPGDEGSADAQGEGEAQQGDQASSTEFNEIVQNATKLGQIDVTKAKALLQLENPNSEDAIKVNKKGKGTCKSLLPSQQSMSLPKAMHFALGMLNNTMYGSGGPGGNLGAFMCGGYLLDGHHRWLSTCMVNPDLSVQGYDMEGIKPGDAVRVLNVATGAVQGHNSGKDGTGSFDPFTNPDDLYKELKNKDAGDVTTGEDGKPLEKAQTSVPKLSGEGNATMLCEKWAKGELSTDVKPKQWTSTGEFTEMPTGDQALRWAAAVMAENCKSCDGVKNGAVLPIGNKRIDMPVADDPSHGGGEAAPGFGDKDNDGTKLADTLTAGGLNLRGELPPELQEESVDLRRWHKLAGILKG